MPTAAAHALAKCAVCIRASSRASWWPRKQVLPPHRKHMKFTSSTEKIVLLNQHPRTLQTPGRHMASCRANCLSLLLVGLILWVDRPPAGTSHEPAAPEGAPVPVERQNLFEVVSRFRHRWHDHRYRRKQDTIRERNQHPMADKTVHEQCVIEENVFFVSPARCQSSRILEGTLGPDRN